MCAGVCVSLLERCPHFRGSYAQSSMELGPEDVSLLERCPHFRGCYVQSSMELGPEDVSLLGSYPHFRECTIGDIQISVSPTDSDEQKTVFQTTFIFCPMRSCYLCRDQNKRVCARGARAHTHTHTHTPPTILSTTVSNHCPRIS